MHKTTAEIEPFPKQTTLRDFFKSTVSTPKVDPYKKEKIIYTQVPGLSLTKNFITEAEETFLWNEVNKLPWRTDLKRRYQIHGYYYDAETKSILEYIGELPQCVSFLAKRLVEEGLLCEMPDQCGVNEYEPGQGIGPHIDRVMFGDQVIMVSLGSDIVMDFHGPNEEIVSILLPRRSAVLAEGKARYEWKHGIAGRRTDKLENGLMLKRNKRISVTLRISRKDIRRQNHPSYYSNKKVEQQIPKTLPEEVKEN